MFMADLIRWSPDTADHLTSVQTSLDSIADALANIHNHMETLRAQNEGVTTTQMYESHQTLHQLGLQHVDTVRIHAGNTLKAFRAAQEQDTANSAGVRVE
jgi:hypothetical protein